MPPQSGRWLLVLAARRALAADGRPRVSSDFPTAPGAVNWDSNAVLWQHRKFPCQTQALDPLTFFPANGERKERRRAAPAATDICEGSAPQVDHGTRFGAMATMA